MLCQILISDTKPVKPLDSKTNCVEVLENGTKFLALVHPCQDSKNQMPGVVVLNSRTRKPKCHTCEGKKCRHINIYICIEQL